MPHVSDSNLSVVHSGHIALRKALHLHSLESWKVHQLFMIIIIKTMITMMMFIMVVMMIMMMMMMMITIINNLKASFTEITINRKRDII